MTSLIRLGDSARRLCRASSPLRREAAIRSASNGRCSMPRAARMPHTESWNLLPLPKALTVPLRSTAIKSTATRGRETGYRATPYGSERFRSAPSSLENDLCSLDVTGMKDEVAGNARSLSALIGFKPAFAGPFSVAVGTTGSAVVRGSWHPGDPGGGPWIVEPVNAASLISFLGWFAPRQCLNDLRQRLGTGNNG